GIGPDGYDDEKIKEQSGCKRAQIRLVDPQSKEDKIIHAEIGICHLSKTTTFCISGAAKEEPSDALIWSRSKYTMVSEISGQNISVSH
ncbi:hypothetical protein U1Q18_046783, partial [Sarracenia purpurea var. burkii]